MIILFCSLQKDVIVLRLLRDINESDINAAVTAKNNVVDAAHEFEYAFKSVLDKVHQ